MGFFEQQGKEPRRILRSARSEGAFAEYARAYREAAQLLAQQGRFDTEDPPNYSAFPVAHLYRHALESAVKGLLMEFRADIRDYRQPEDILKYDHNLGKLVEPLKELRKIYPDEFAEAEVGDMTFGALETLLKNWETYDPRALMFRYGIEKKKPYKPTLPHKDFALNMAEFADSMDAAIEFVLEVRHNILKTNWQEIERDLVGSPDPEVEPEWP